MSRKNENKKATVQPELLQRLIAASANGSVVAKAILEDLKKPKSEVLKSNTADNFGTKRYMNYHGFGDERFSQIQLKISYCQKDFSNPMNPEHGNPDGVQRSDQRVYVTPTQFALLFKREFDHIDLDYFESAILCNSKVTVRLKEKFEDFEHAYNGAHYSVQAEKGATLQQSCMRHDDTALSAADFYKNFARVKILVATNGDNEVVGRAVVWDGVRINFEGHQATIKYMERRYFSYYFVRHLLEAKAIECGVQLKKRKDECGCTDYFTTCDILDDDCDVIQEGYEIEDPEMQYDVHPTKWFKRGAPYLDTFNNLLYNRASNRFYLATRDVYGSNSSRLATFCETCGRANQRHYICAKCGKIVEDCNPTGSGRIHLCHHCYDEEFETTELGMVAKGKSKKVGRTKMPSAVADSPYSFMAMSISKLY